MIEQGMIWTFDDGSKFVVVSIISIGGSKYVYLANLNDYKDYIIAEYLGDEIEEVDDPDLLENLLLKFNEDLKESLPKVIEELM